MRRKLADCPIGVMQGRLLPKYKGRFQAHPVGKWAEEFYLARKLGFDCIELIVDLEEIELNPLMSEAGTSELLNTISDSGVVTHSVCADYLMDVPLHAPSTETRSTGLHILSQLIRASVEIGYSLIVIPCVDRSKLEDLDAQLRLVASLREIAPMAADFGVSLALESDLRPSDFALLLDQVGHTAITVNYDIGNSAALGFNHLDEFQSYGRSISDVHIKDRLFQGGSVPLGTGAADIPMVIQCLEEVEYDGPLILQAFRDDDGFASTSEQLTTFRHFLGDLQ